MREQLIGLHLIPVECDLITDCFWPAKIEKEINIQNLIKEQNKENSLDITDLPIYNVKETNKLHKTIKDQITKLKKDDPFTIDNDGLDLTTHQVQSYTIFGYMIMSVFVFINSTLIICLYIRSIRKWLRKKDLDKEIFLRQNFRDSTNSLNLTRKRVFEKTCQKARDWSDWSRSSAESIRSKTRNKRRRRNSRKKSVTEIDNNESAYSTDTNDTKKTNKIDVGTNTRKIEKKTLS